MDAPLTPQTQHRAGCEGLGQMELDALGILVFGRDRTLDEVALGRDPTRYRSAQARSEGGVRDFYAHAQVGASGPLARLFEHAAELGHGRSVAGESLCGKPVLPSLFGG